MTQTANHPMAQPPVLLIEDEPRYREMLQEAVAEMGFEVRGVGTAEQSLRALAQKPFGIAILDLNLPGMGGVDLLEIIRRDHSAIQFVILTGFGNLEDARRAMRCDVVDFITKPCQLDELELSLSRACNRWRRAVSMTAMAPDKPGAQPPASLSDVERTYILAAMKRHRGNRRAVATELGVSLRTLYNRLRDYRRLKYIDLP